MSLNETPSANRTHIAFFGRRNVGKSSLVNKVTNQELSVVSNVKGTTTDPVYKAMELLPMGPVMIIDTPGFDDEGTLGKLRVEKTKQILAKTDIAILVVDVTTGILDVEKDLINMFKNRNIDYIIAYNKSDLIKEKHKINSNEIYVSAKNNIGIYELKEKIAKLSNNNTTSKRIVGDLLCDNDLVVLVVPIDKAAPKGRLILPQQQVIRDILDSNAMAIVTKESQLESTLSKLKQEPKMVITDSQVFDKVSVKVPKNIPLTSFSILMARYKGFLQTAIKGVCEIKNLKDGDSVLIVEGCTHHRQCNDIGTVKIPAWLKKYTGKKIVIKTCSGREFKEDLSEFKLVIHCGGCMLTEREVNYRKNIALQQNVPFINYGILIAYINGILKRGISIFI